MAAHIIHIGAGWYHIVVAGHQMTLARGKANAEAKAEQLMNTEPTIKQINIDDVYMRFIKKETN